jgi:hypothetical protein
MDTDPRSTGYDVCFEKAPVALAFGFWSMACNLTDAIAHAQNGQALI